MSKIIAMTTGEKLVDKLPKAIMNNTQNKVTFTDNSVFRDNEDLIKRAESLDLLEVSQWDRLLLTDRGFDSSKSIQERVNQFRLVLDTLADNGFNDLKINLVTDDKKLYEKIQNKLIEGDYPNVEIFLSTEIINIRVLIDILEGKSDSTGFRYG